MDIFITGSTGLLGTHLINELSKKDDIDKIFALVRDIELNPDFNSEKIILLKGDVTLKNLGLNDDEIQDLKNVEEVYHLAALVTLSNNDEKKPLIYNVNVNGTKNLLDLFKDNKNIKKIFYVSSAYSCGYYEKKVPEKWLDKPENFRNFYESTKFEAEQLVKDYSDKYDIPYIILRPSILLSDYPEDSDKTKNHTIYLYGKIIYKLLKEIKFNPINFRLIGNPDSKLNFILVRDLIECFINSRNNKIVKSISNVTNPLDTPIRDILLSIKKGLKYNGDLNFVENINNPNNLELAAMKMTEPFTKYTLDHWISWETKHQFFNNSIDNDWIMKHIEEYLNKVVTNEK